MASQSGNDNIPLDIRNPELWVPAYIRPVLLELPFRVKFIECGAYHTMAISSENLVFACGLNASGQLGIPSLKSNALSLNLVK